MRMLVDYAEGLGLSITYKTTDAAALLPQIRKLTFIHTWEKDDMPGVVDDFIKVISTPIPPSFR